MNCSEKTDLQRKCNTAWNAYAEYAEAVNRLALRRNLKALTPPLAAIFRKRCHFTNAYHESVRALEQHLIRHRCC
jgi:hypothetical protein